jgi:hypothetical protein
MRNADVQLHHDPVRAEHVPLKKSLNHACAITVMALAFNGSAHATGAESDGWITPQPGHDMAIFYLGRDSFSTAHSNSKLVERNARLDANFSLLRYTHPIQVGDTVLNPQFIQPLSKISTDGNLSGLGSASGAGDLMLLLGIFPIHDWANKTHLAIVPYLWLPTGSYDRNKPLNAGENRWKAALQVGGQFPISESFVISLTADTTFFGKNKEAYGGGTLSQRPLSEIRGWLKYDMKSLNYAHWALGLGHVTGGETRLNDIRQYDAKATTTAHFQVGTLLDDSKTNHILFSVSRDLKVKNGLRMDTEFMTRFAHIF